MLSIEDIKDPLASLVGKLAQELKIRFQQFGNRCREYACSQAEDPEFARSLTVQTTSVVRSAPSERKENIPEGPFERPKRQADDLPMKKPRNAYNLFVASESVKIKEQNPHMRAPDIVRVAAERYNNMTPEQKRPYIEKFEEAKRLYEEQQNDLSRSGAPVRRGRGGFGRGGRYDYTLK